MNFYISNKELDAQILEIRRKIRLSMNGVVSDRMKQSGIVYKENYGVSIPRLKEIAKDYSPNHDLAQRLWLLGIRETMILSVLLEPIETFTIEMAKKRINEVAQMEMVEQLSMNVFCKLPFAMALCVDSVCSEKLWIRITGFMLSVRIYNKLSVEATELIIHKALEYSSTDNFYLYKTIALCLSRFCRIDKQTANVIKEKTALYLHSEQESYRYIAEEVKHEIIFLENL